ncbi:MAG: BREX-4 system phosphatase PglZ [Anaerolineae bacterium]|nr:BREX-4 system phosphatase PglZ [Anaerolineae bacterium]
MTVHDVETLLTEVSYEAVSYTRFPVRFILVTGVNAWRELIPALRAQMDACIDLSSLCESEDVLPYLPKVLALARSQEVPRAVVLPVAEALRLHPASSSLLSQLAQLEKPGHQRIYVPLLEVEDLFGETVARMDRYLAGALHPGWRLVGTGEISISVSASVPQWRRPHSIPGLREYFRRWERGEMADGCLVTSRPQVLSGRAGRVAITVYTSAFAQACQEIAGLDSAASDWGTEDQWRWLVEQAHQHDSVSTLAARQLNVVKYDPDRLLGQWLDLEPEARWLLWVWSKLEAPRDSYYGLVLEESQSAEALPQVAATAALGRNLSFGHLRERRQLLEHLGVDQPPSSFWQGFRTLQTPLKRLRALSGLSEREKREAVLATAELLETEVSEDVWLPVLEVCYPELAIYLTAYPYPDHPEVMKYFRLYARSRVCDRLLPGLVAMATAAAERKALWEFPTRAETIKAACPGGAKIVWLDAVGLEWAGLMSELLVRRGHQVRVHVARANLPSTTEHNREWGEEERPPRDMDKEAHSYDYRYPDSLVRQLEFISSVCHELASTLDPGETALLTADHGLTRFGADGQPVAAPREWRVHHWGRYADIAGGECHRRALTDCCLFYDGWAHLAVHGRFSGGGSNRGEVHGGATYEECLVPVILVQRAGPELVRLPVTFKVLSPTVRVSARGEGHLETVTSLPLEELRLVVAGHWLKGSRTGRDRWAFDVSRLRAGHYKGRLESPGQSPGQVEFEVRRGIAEDDMGLQGVWSG